MEETTGNKKRIIILIVIVLVAFIAGVTIGNSLFQKYQKDIDDAFKSGEDLGFEIANLYAMNTNMSDVPFQHYSGEVYSIENYSSFNISNLSYDKFTIYKLTLDLRGFFPDQIFSSYVNPRGIRYVTFRYSDDGPFPGSGYYSFYYLDKDIIEITHWE